MKKQRGVIPFVVLLLFGVFFVGGTAGAFIAWWMGANAPTIAFFAFAFGIIMGLVFLPNAPRVIHWGKAVSKEWKS